MKQIPSAQRIFLCQGEEATVFRLSGRKFNNKVERLTEIKNENCFSFIHNTFTISCHFDVTYPHFIIAPSYASYNVFKFLSLKLAKLLFPNNFVNCRNLLFFRIDGRNYSAIYSDFVSDENNTIKRKTEAIRRYRTNEPDIREKSDSLESQLVPALPQIALEINKSGLLIPHPETNYHLSDSKIVFFEIQAIDLNSLLDFIKSKDENIKLGALRWMALITSTYFRFRGHFYEQYVTNSKNYLNYFFFQLLNDDLQFLESSSRGRFSMLNNNIHYFSYKYPKIKLPKQFYTLAEEYDPFVVENYSAKVK